MTKTNKKLINSEIAAVVVIFLMSKLWGEFLVAIVKFSSALPEFLVIFKIIEKNK